MTDVTDVTVDMADVPRSADAAPAVVDKLRARIMVAIEGGTQVLRRSMSARLEVTPGVMTTISVSRPA